MSRSNDYNLVPGNSRSLDSPNPRGIGPWTGGGPGIRSPDCADTAEARSTTPPPAHRPSAFEPGNKGGRVAWRRATDRPRSLGRAGRVVTETLDHHHGTVL